MSPQTATALQPHQIQPMVQERIYEAGCELEQIASLLASIMGQLDSAYDPHGITAAASDLARIGFDRVRATLDKLVAADSACLTCWNGRNAIAEMLLDPAMAVPHMWD